MQLKDHLHSKENKIHTFEGKRWNWTLTTERLFRRSANTRTSETVHDVKLEDVSVISFGTESYSNHNPEYLVWAALLGLATFAPVFVDLLPIAISVFTAIATIFLVAAYNITKDSGQDVGVHIYAPAFDDEYSWTIQAPDGVDRDETLKFVKTIRKAQAV